MVGVSSGALCEWWRLSPLTTGPPECPGASPSRSPPSRPNPRVRPDDRPDDAGARSDKRAAYEVAAVGVLRHLDRELQASPLPHRRHPKVQAAEQPARVHVQGDEFLQLSARAIACGDCSGGQRHLWPGNRLGCRCPDGHQHAGPRAHGRHGQPGTSPRLSALPTASTATGATTTPPPSQRRQRHHLTVGVSACTSSGQQPGATHRPLLDRSPPGPAQAACHPHPHCAALLRCSRSLLKRASA